LSHGKGCARQIDLHLEFMHSALDKCPKAHEVSNYLIDSTFHISAKGSYRKDELYNEVLLRRGAF